MKKSLSILGILLAQSICAAEFSAPIPKAFAVLGDSMSEGMLANYSLEKRMSFADLVSLIWNAADADREARILAFRKLFADRSKSWAGGDDSTDLIFSHFERLRELNQDLKVENFAVSGDESWQLEAQVTQFLEAERQQGMAFDYITLMIGANDIAKESVAEVVPKEKYASNIEKELRRILAANVDRRILIVGLPDMHTILESSQDFTVYDYWYDRLSCASMRRQAYGNRILFYPERKEEYLKTKEIVAEYRDALQDLVARLSIEFYATSFKLIRKYRLPTSIKKSLSIDCFHPSEWGQAELAEVTWAEGFWPNILPPDFNLWQNND